MKQRNYLLGELSVKGFKYAIKEYCKPSSREKRLHAFLRHTPGLDGVLLAATQIT